MEALVDRATHLDRLRQSRLLDEEQFRQAEALPGATAGALSDALIDGGLLTPFQAHSLERGEPRHLVLGPYHIQDELGRGGMGRVYKALHTVMGRVVALKVIAPERLDSPTALDWFRREVRTLTRLQHPNVVMAFDANEAEGLHFLVMEHVEGSSLDAVVRRQGPLPWAQACEVMRQAALGLQHAHEKGMVHRDVKPANLLLPTRPTGELPTDPWLSASDKGPGAAAPPAVKIVDFGLARLQDGGATLAGGDGFFGTPDYVAPEQCRDVHAADVRSDLYSLGCTFYFALTGRPPFPGETAMDKLLAHLSDDAPSVLELAPEVPPVVAGIVARLMAKDPGDRFQTPAELARALAPLGAPDTTRPQVFVLEPLGAAVGAAEGTRPSTPAPFGGRGRGEEQVWASEGGLGPSAPENDFPNEAAPLVETVFPHPPAPRDAAALRRSWCRWRDVLEALERGAGLPLQEAEYRSLYAEVLAGCADQAVGGPPERRAALTRLEGLVRPWVTLTSLVRADPAIRASLLEQCREVELVLGLGGPSASWAPALLVLALGAVLMMALLWPWGETLPTPQVVRPLLASVRANSKLWAAFLGPPVVILGAMYFMVRRRATA